MDETSPPQILVDADACPVKDEVVRVATRHGLKVTFVANFGLRPSRDPMIENVVVPQGPDAADDWIAERARAGDIVITSDIPLARRALEQGAAVMGPTGKPFTTESIGMALAMRGLNQHLRETGESRGLNASFTPRDRSAFLQALDEAVVRAKRAGRLMPEWRFTARVIEWRGPAPFYYAPLPADVAAEIAAIKKQASYGWGVIPVNASISDTAFETSLFPRDGTYLLPLKDKVRRPLGVTVGDTVSVTMTIGGRIREPDL